MSPIRPLEGGVGDIFREFYDRERGYFAPSLPRGSSTWNTLIDSLHSQGFTGRGQTIAILDTGFVPEHPAISRALIQKPSPLDWTGEGIRDHTGHGTLISLLVLAIAPEARLMHIKIASTDNKHSLSRGAATSLIAKAIKKAAQCGATVINISAGLEREGQESLNLLDSKVGPCNCEACFTAEETAQEFGVTIIAAAGNDPRAGVRYCPASAAEVTPVIGIANGTPIALPSLTYYSGVRGLGTVRFSGTTGSSFAAPLVSGTAALVAQQSQAEVARGTTFDLDMILRAEGEHIITIPKTANGVPQIPRELFKRNCRHAVKFVHDLEVLCRMDSTEVKVRMPPLVFAALRGEPDEIRARVERGEDINGQDSEGFTALMIAAQKGDSATLQVLLGLKANLDAHDKHGVTALHISAGEGLIAIVKALLAGGANPNLRDNDSITPLMVAAMKGHVGSVEALVQGGADVNAKDKQGRSALLYAAGEGHSAVVETLLAGRAEPDASDENGLTPLVFAIGEGHTSMVNALLLHGADANRHGFNGFTPLMWAAMHGRPKIAKMLLKHGVEINATNDSGQTLLMLAMRDGQARLVRTLLLRGANPVLRDNMGRTVVEYISGDRATVTVRILISIMLLTNVFQKIIAIRLKKWLPWL